MGRMIRQLNPVCTVKDTWYEIFSEADYKSNKIKEIKVKLRETTSADHFRYTYKVDSIVAGVISASVYGTSSPGFNSFRNVKKLYVFVPDYDGEVIEVEIIYF